MSADISPARTIHEPDYQVVHRSETDRDPRDVEYYYQRRVREYDDDRDHRLRREISPHDSVSQVSTRRHRDRDRDREYSSDDSMVYIRKETREYDDEPHHHKRHLAEGAILGVGAMELMRHRSKSQGRQVSGKAGRVGQDVGAAALGAVAANAIEHYRSKSRHRSSSVDDDRSSRHTHHRRHRSRHRSRSRSSSHSRAKTLAGIGLGAAAIAGAVAVARKKSQSNRDRRSRSRHRRDSPSRGDDARAPSKNRNQHIAAAGVAGAAAAGIIEKVRSRSRSRKGESRSRSRIRQGLPIVAAGLGSAAVAGLYENRKAKKEGETGSRARSRSVSRSRSAKFPDPGKESTGLIEYGQDPLYGNIPAADYYGRPASPQGYHPDAVVPAGAVDSRHRSQSRGFSPSESDSDRSHRRRHRRRERRERSGSRIRDFAEAGLAAAGLGYAANKISGKKDRKDKEHRRRSRK